MNEGGTFTIAAKNKSYWFFSRRMSSSSLSSSSSCLITLASRLNYDNDMAKAAGPVVHSALRAIPSVDRILSTAAFAPLLQNFGREQVKGALVDHLTTLRATRGSYD